MHGVLSNAIDAAGPKRSLRSRLTTCQFGTRPYAPPMLLTGRNLSKSYGPRLLFSGITLGLAEGERVGLIGANGSGKSTLLRIFAGLEQPDDGELVARRNLRVGYVAQADDFDAETTCLDVVANAIDDPHLDDHERHLRAAVLLDRAGFGGGPDAAGESADPAALAGTLSGGWRKRLAIVRQLARSPDLLLLDEPTNHLDLEGIEWLEKVVTGGAFATLTVTHDRRFLENVATRIVELGKAYPEGYLSVDGAYTAFVEKREQFLEAQEGRERSLASGVRREVEWLQRGAKARTTKAKGRIERAGQMQADLAQLRQRNAKAGPAGIDFNASERKTRKLLSLAGVAASVPDRDGDGRRTLFSGVDVTLSPGAALGLLGPNGSGKSTLIGVMTGRIAADAGTVFRADGLQVVVFDQHRDQLDPAQTLRAALGPTGDQIRFRDEPMHITAWAKRFLFRTEQLDLPVGQLSGGEQARVLIARLMLRPADVLILDEPTNDLDLPTLGVLETALESFPGAVVLVTHDRYLLDRVSTDLLALDGKGGADLYADLSQWQRAREARRAEASARRSAPTGPASSNGDAATPAKKKRSWKEQKEFEGMEAAILDAEGSVESLQAAVADPAVLADHVKARDAYEKLGAAQSRVEALYARWSELEG